MSTRRCLARGFTLLELMIVVALAGIIMSMVVFTATPNPARKLEQDAQGLAQIMRIAQDEAQVRDRALQWQGDADGWRFLVRTSQAANGWEVLRDDLFKAHVWSSRLDALQWSKAPALNQQAANTESRPGALSIVIGQEAISTAYSLQLRRNGWQVNLRSDGAGQFTVSEPQPI